MEGRGGNYWAPILSIRLLFGLIKNIISCMNCGQQMLSIIMYKFVEKK